MDEQVQAERQRSRIRGWLLAAVILTTLGAGAFWTSARQHNAQAAADPDNADAVKSVVHLESFVVNLADADQAAFLRVGIDLGVGQIPKAQPPIDKGSLLLPKIRDVILAVLTTSQSSELLAVDGKTRLKQRLLSALNAQVPDLPIKEVYFTEFLVQR